jgi:hypothetical protein
MARILPNTSSLPSNFLQSVSALQHQTLDRFLLFLAVT